MTNTYFLQFEGTKKGSTKLPESLKVSLKSDSILSARNLISEYFNIYSPLEAITDYQFDLSFAQEVFLGPTYNTFYTSNAQSLDLS